MLSIAPAKTRQRLDQRSMQSQTIVYGQFSGLRSFPAIFQWLLSLAKVAHMLHSLLLQTFIRCKRIQ